MCYLFAPTPLCRNHHRPGYHLGVLNTCISVMARQWGLSDVTLSPYATSALLVGAAIGCLLGGAAADAFGPRHALFYNNAILLLGPWLCCVSQQPLTLCIGTSLVGAHSRARVETCPTGRLVAGLGCGAASLFVPRYIAEVAPPDVRGALGTLTQVCHPATLRHTHVVYSRNRCRSMWAYWLRI